MVNGAVREIVGVKDGTNEDEEPRKIMIMRTEIAYHRHVYRVSMLSHIQYSVVAADRLCKWLTKWGKALDLLFLSVH